MNEMNSKTDAELTDIRDRCYLQMCCTEAGKSPDTSTRNGACLVCRTAKPGHYYTDCNRFSVFDQMPIGRAALIEPILADRDKKMMWIEHAERNAIFKAVRDHAHIGSSTLYCPFSACVDCARTIVLTGVAELVRLPRDVLPWPQQWVESIQEAERILRAGGVKVTDYRGPALGRTYFVDRTEYEV